jgi:hypothetical protein
VTATNLPRVKASIGDLEVGDVDADGDLDLVLADWGPGSPTESRGAPPMLWLNNGHGRFTDVSRSNMPPNRIRFSWELELVDIDNDWDLDLAVSCKVCATERPVPERWSWAIPPREGRDPRFHQQLRLRADGRGCRRR